MQEVLPGVLLGSSSDATRFAELRRQRVTHLLHVSVDGGGATHPPTTAARTACADHFEYGELRLSDTTLQRIIPLIPPVANFVQKALAQGGRVLLCDSERPDGAVALLLGYLIHVQGVTCLAATELLRKRLPNVSLCHSFEVQLFEYEAIALARQQCLRTASQLDVNKCRPQRRPCPFVDVPV